MKIAVIGAGISGLKAAAELKRQGHTVKVFEKSRGVGGRLACKRMSWGTIDIGAQYFTARTALFQEEVKNWLAKGVVQQWRFAPHKMKIGQAHTSPDDRVRYVGIPTMNALTHYLASDLSISFNATVIKLTKMASKWTLITAEGQQSSDFDWIVLSIPPEQCGRLLVEGSDIYRDLPNSVHAPCWALALATHGYVPSDFQGIFGDDTCSWVSRQSSKPMQLNNDQYDDLWVVHFSPSWSKTEGKDTTKDLPVVGVEWLNTALGCNAKVVYHYQHYWRYAQYIANKAEVCSYFVDENQQVAVIGGWCCGGRVEGGYQSALTLVKNVFKGL